MNRWQTVQVSFRLQRRRKLHMRLDFVLYGPLKEIFHLHFPTLETPLFSFLWMSSASGWTVPPKRGLVAQNHGRSCGPEGRGTPGPEAGSASRCPFLTGGVPSALGNAHGCCAAGYGPGRRPPSRPPRTVPISAHRLLPDGHVSPPGSNFIRFSDCDSSRHFDMHYAP